MYHDSKILNVFLASPGDLTDERQIARDVVDELNLSMGRQLNWRVDLLGWEDTMPGSFRPQEKINEDVDRCELFVGMLWKRWGQPTGQGEYQSGFEEELERVRTRRRSGDLPEIWLFLKAIPEDALRDPGDQLRKVIAFRAAVEKEKSLKYTEFHDGRDWERIFRKSLTSYLLTLSRDDRSPTSSKLPTTSPDTESGEVIPPESAETESTASKDKNALDAVRSLETVAGAVRAGELSFDGDGNLGESDLARITVLAAAFFASRYTDELLGVHQAHLLYKSQSTISLTGREWSIAIRSMFGSSAGLVPGWFWIRPSIKVRRYLIDLILGDTNALVRAGAARTVRDLHLQLAAKERSTLLKGLLARYEESVAKPILAWVGENGDLRDQWFFDELLKGHSSLKDDVDKYRIGLLARVRPSALVAYISNNNLELPKALAVKIAPKLDITSLRSLLANKNKGARKFSARAMAALHALPKDTISQLINDDDPDMRVIGIQAAVESGQALSPAIIREKIPQSSSPLGLLMSSTRAETFVRGSFENFEYSELLKFLRWDATDAILAYEVLGLKYFDKFASILRSDLRDNFEKYQRQWEDDLLSRLGDAGRHFIIDYEKKGLNSFIRKEYLSAALRVLAINGGEADDSTMRSHLTSSDSNILVSVARYLGRFGSSGDARTILEIAEKTWTNTTDLLSWACKLADDATVFLFDSTIHAKLRARLLPFLSNTEILGVKDRWMDLLLEQDSEIRKQALRRIFIVTNSKERKKLLRDYLNGPTYYYDVVYWLDRLCYAPPSWTLPFFKSLEAEIQSPFRD